MNHTNVMSSKGQVYARKTLDFISKMVFHYAYLSSLQKLPGSLFIFFFFCEVFGSIKLLDEILRYFNGVSEKGNMQYNICCKNKRNFRYDQLQQQLFHKQPHMNVNMGS